MKTAYVEVGQGRDSVRMTILFEDRSVMAIDKPAGWLLVPYSWDRTPRNLQAALAGAIQDRHYWATSRNLKFLRHIHRLDGDTTGILLLAKSLGAVNTYGDLFESRRMAKVYLAVVQGEPRKSAWTCQAPIGRDLRRVGRMRVDPKEGKESETHFRVLHTQGDRSLVEARPVTGRTHQIRLHLEEAGHSVLGDDLYGPNQGVAKAPLKHRPRFPLALRAVRLAYPDPFQNRTVRIAAPCIEFLRAFGIRTDVDVDAKLDEEPAKGKPTRPA